MNKATEWDHNAVKAMLKVHGIKALLELVREHTEEDAIPEGCPDATRESQQSYVAIGLLDDVINSLEKV